MKGQFLWLPIGALISLVLLKTICLLTCDRYISGVLSANVNNEISVLSTTKIVPIISLQNS